ncbi:MAG: MFS transporter [Actinomycetota bacterium]|nr:MFS transporter [Actinomycetota bacterium]
MKNRRLLIMFAIVLVDMLSFSIVLPLLPYLAGDLGASAAQIGMLTAMYPLAQVFASPILGRLSDRFGRKPILVVSILGTTVGFVVLATARLLPILFVSRFIDGITGGNISVAQAYIADVTDEKERGAALGLIGAAFGMGFILGPVTGGLLSGISFALPAWVGAGLALTNALVVIFLLPESLSAQDRSRLRDRPKRRVLDPRGLAEAFAHKRVGPLLAMRTATGLGFAIFETSFALWAIAALGLSPQANGAVLGYVGVLSVIVQLVVIKRLTSRFSDDGILLWSLATAAVALALWGFVPNVWMLLVLMPALSVGLAVTNTVLTSALTKAVHRDEVGGILGLQTSIQSFTRIPAPVIAGALIGFGPVWSPGLLAGVTVGAMVPYAYLKLCWRPGAPACVDEDIAQEMSSDAVE